MSARSELLKIYELSSGRRRYQIYLEGPGEYRLYVVGSDVTQPVEKTYRSLNEALRALRELVEEEGKKNED